MSKLITKCLINKKNSNFSAGFFTSFLKTKSYNKKFKSQKKKKRNKNLRYDFQAHFFAQILKS
jgi:hypothetical protein